MKHFTFEELEHSAIADALHIDNYANEKVRANLRRLVDEVLDPARELLGIPITVNSGFRCPSLNRAVGGAKRSYHLYGRAADLNAGSRADNRRLLQILRTLPHTELIDEHSSTWIHVAL